MRQVESGQERTSSFGKTAWNIFGGLINERLNIEGETVVIGWRDGIHSKLLFQASTEANLEGVSKLKELYDASLQGSFDI